MDKIEEIKKLKKLLDDGAITEEEFSIEKSKLLDIPIPEYKIEEKKDIVEEEPKKEDKNNKIPNDKNGNNNVNKIKKVLLWLLSIVLFLAAFGSFIDLKTNFILNLVYGIIFAILGILACPSISEATKKYEQYTKMKKYIVILTIIALIIVANIFG